MAAIDARHAERTRRQVPLLPAQRLDQAGRARIDFRAIAQLALPLMLNSSVHAVISLTDTWFVGQISTTAMAAMASIYWIVIFFIVLFSGVGLAVQTLVAQAEGSRRRRRAGHALWVAIWGSMLTFPLFALAALSGSPLLEAAGVGPEVRQLALEFWWPRMLGAPIGVALWAIFGFFNGISRPAITFATLLLVAVSNAALNQLLIFELGYGMAGAAWATNLSMLLGVAASLAVFLGPATRRSYRSDVTWRFSARGLRRQLRVGLPMGLLYAADIFGMALFQLMQVRLSQVDGAVTQAAMMLTSMAYMPGVGIALAGTTLVGQSIGAGDRDWAQHLGNTVIALAMGFMGLIGVAIALSGPWLLPFFVAAGDPDAQAFVQLGSVLLWIAAGYQVFDGLNLGSGFSLRGAGDAAVPAALAVALSWGFFVPLTHMLSFAPGEGFVDFLPQFGLGAVGGWLALLAYVAALGTALFLRWRSGAWRRIRV
jgi:MATE family multidrug resistance protein